MQLRESNGIPTICDPACGSGGFLLRAAKLLERDFGISQHDAFRNHIVGIDRDENAVRYARCLIELACAARGETPEDSSPQLYCRDSLTTETATLLEAVGQTSGFDVVATNPPYVRLQSLLPDYRQEIEQRYGEFIKGSYSLALLFLVAGQRLLGPGGSLAYITQNNFFTSLAGEPVRHFLVEQGCLDRIVDFGHEQVFEGTGAYTCLMFLRHGGRDRFDYCRVHAASARNLKQLRFSSIEYDRLDAKKWRLADAKHLDNLKRIERTGTPLGQLTEIRVGFATLKDRVFFAMERDGRCFAQTADGAEREIEFEATKPAVKVADLQQQHDLRNIKTRIIFPYVAYGDTWRVIARSDFRELYPRAVPTPWWLVREELSTRDKGREPGDGWYAWGSSSGTKCGGTKAADQDLRSTTQLYARSIRSAVLQRLQCFAPRF